MNINVDFTKVAYTRTSYAVESIVDWILGKSNSTLYEYSRNTNSPRFCGFFLPPFQRPEVWELERKIRLMESLFCEINVGTLMYVSNYDAPEVDGWLIDGQQRLATVRDFVLGKFSIFNNQLSYTNMGEVTLTFKGEEPKKASVIWRRTDLSFNKIERVKDVSVLKELYNRLNFGGVAHKENEKA